MDEKFENPILILAKELEGVEYPRKPKNIILKIFFIILPCGIPIILSYFIKDLNSLFLTFAGAFASIQLAGPYEKYSQKWRDFFINSREDLEENFFSYFIKKIDFSLRPSIIEISHQVKRENNYTRFTSISRPRGYSPFQLYLARIRFPRIAKQWDKHFIATPRVISPGEEPPQPVYLYIDYRRAKEMDYYKFIRNGRSKFTKLLRTLFCLLLYPISLAISKYKNSDFYIARKKAKAQRILIKVGKEIYNVRERKGSQDSIVWLAAKLNFPPIDDVDINL